MRDPGIAANCAARPPLKSVVVGRYTRLGGTPSDDGAEVRGVKGAYVNPAWTCTFNTAGITEDFMNNVSEALQGGGARAAPPPCVPAANRRGAAAGPGGCWPVRAMPTAAARCGGCWSLHAVVTEARCGH